MVEIPLNLGAICQPVCAARTAVQPLCKSGKKRQCHSSGFVKFNWSRSTQSQPASSPDGRTERHWPKGRTRIIVRMSGGRVREREDGETQLTPFTLKSKHCFEFFAPSASGILQFSLDRLANLSQERRRLSAHFEYDAAAVRRSQFQITMED